MTDYTFILIDSREVTYSAASEKAAFNLAYAAHGAAVAQIPGRVSSN